MRPYGFPSTTGVPGETHSGRRPFPFIAAMLALWGFSSSAEGDRSRTDTLLLRDNWQFLFAGDDSGIAVAKSRSRRRRGGDSARFSLERTTMGVPNKGSGGTAAKLRFRNRSATEIFRSNSKGSACSPGSSSTAQLRAPAPFRTCRSRSIARRLSSERAGSASPSASTAG